MTLAFPFTVVCCTVAYSLLRDVLYCFLRHFQSGAGSLVAFIDSNTVLEVLDMHACPNPPSRRSERISLLGC